VASLLDGEARTAVGGSGPKGEAIAGAALRLFLRDGYERTSVDAIAAEAGVSKRTIYNRYTDKENLFRSVLRDCFATMLATFRRIADAHFAEGSGPSRSGAPARDSIDVERDLTAFVREAALTLTMAPERLALVRLILTEAPYFPALAREEAGQMSMHATLARVLTRLAQAGWLELTDPDEAAEHLFALTFAQAGNRSMFQGEPLSEPEVDRIVTSGVRVFLRAYGTRA
jgi:TetR/AcrR family transcriptional regulator, mexJK operon transcriptional repressor